MREKQNKRTLCLTVLACILVFLVTTKSAMAYFTTYTTAVGGQELELEFTTTVPHENVSNWTKEITIENQGSTECYVRVKVLAGSQFVDGLTFSDASGKWTPGIKGYYYYSDILGAKEFTSPLNVKIDNMDAEQSFNVVVVQESTPVLYDTDGNAYADWNATVTSDGQIQTNQD